MYDIIILGGGAAGMTAAIYSARYNLKPILISENLGGLIIDAHKVENYPGLNKLSGMELMSKFEEHVRYFNVEIKEQSVIDIKKTKDGFLATTNKAEKIGGKAIIFALGTQKRKLNIKDEEKFSRKGISYCYTCDAPFYKGMNVAVVGGGDSACAAARLLSEYCPKVYIIAKEGLGGEPYNISSVRSKKNIEILEHVVVSKIDGSKMVESVTLSNGKRLDVRALFVEIGSIPSTELVKGVKVGLDETGYIKVNDKMQTNIDGIFAAGDVTTGSGGLRQVITAAAEGAIAANSAFNYLRIKRENPKI
ncbi:MAG: FAD-dependent oxidoreductase [Candidatus Nanoarchaeia archaeon]|nr:FAD-dependent oxidoreductase [Candidatus Nanoarchaeia archaeon]